MTTANVRSPIDESREDVDPPHAEPAWDVATLFPNQGQWSEEEYFALSTNRQVELSDGRIEVLPMPTRLHAAIAFLMCTLLRAFVREDELA
jgi:Uma2 family endonuclease